MRLDWSDTARANLRALSHYIALDNPVAAEETVKRIIAAAGRLSRFPNSGRPGRTTGTRELIVSGSPYILPYRITRDAVVIVAVIHSAREPKGEPPMGHPWAVQ